MEWLKRLGFGAKDGRLESGWASRRLENLLSQPSSKMGTYFFEPGKDTL